MARGNCEVSAIDGTHSACNVFNEMARYVNVRRKKVGERNNATWTKTGQNQAKSAVILGLPRQGTEVVWFQELRV